MKDLGDRMKRYEAVSCSSRLPINTPAIIRVDGRAFHTFTKGLKRPFDDGLRTLMEETMLHLCQNITGARFAYTQSDEISVVLQDWEKHETQAWFDYDVLKLSTLSASMATAYFNRNSHRHLPTSHSAQLANFDGRAFSLPREEVCNYFIWRQKDWERNSIGMAARSVASQKSLDGLSVSQQHEVLFSNGVNWNDYPIRHKRGSACVPIGDRGWGVEREPPVFARERGYVNDTLPEWPNVVAAREVVAK